MELRPHTVKAMSLPLVTEWTYFVLLTGIFIEELPGSNRHDSFISMLNEDAHIPTDFYDDRIVQVMNTSKPAYEHLNHSLTRHRYHRISVGPSRRNEQDTLGDANVVSLEAD